MTFATIKKKKKTFKNPNKSKVTAVAGMKCRNDNFEPVDRRISTPAEGREEARRKTGGADWPRPRKRRSQHAAVQSVGVHLLLLRYDRFLFSALRGEALLIFIPCDCPCRPFRGSVHHAGRQVLRLVRCSGGPHGLHPPDHSLRGTAVAGCEAAGQQPM